MKIFFKKETNLFKLFFIFGMLLIPMCFGNPEEDQVQPIPAPVVDPVVVNLALVDVGGPKAIMDPRGEKTVTIKSGQHLIIKLEKPILPYGTLKHPHNDTDYEVDYGMDVGEWGDWNKFFNDIFPLLQEKESEEVGNNNIYFLKALESSEPEEREVFIGFMSHTASPKHADLTVIIK